MAVESGILLHHGYNKCLKTWESASMGPLIKSQKFWKLNTIGIIWYQNACSKTIFHATNLG